MFDLEKEHSQKENILGKMNNLLKAMMKGNKVEAQTQVDEGELKWFAK